MGKYISLNGVKPCKEPDKHQTFRDRSYMVPQQEKTQVKNDREMSQSQTTDQLMAPRERGTEYRLSQDSLNTF